ncbi:transglutaminase-like domain-containing protein [Mycoplasmopsis fermentans]|nr:transglutaminase-like domain-containing protein [Mycoplasmopsis fermentans]ADN69409.1 conserved hypothetical membrane associated protein [Mycoplasmopsis fermentans JER]
MKKNKIFNWLGTLTAIVSLPTITTSCFWDDVTGNIPSTPSTTVTPVTPEPGPGPAPKPGDNKPSSIYKYGLKENTKEEKEANEVEKALYLSKVKYFVSDVETVKDTTSSKVDLLVKKALKLKKELLELNEKIFNAFGLHEGRFESYLNAYKNFVNIGFVQSNTGLTATINGNPEPTIKYILENYISQGSLLNLNYKFFNDILSNIEKSVKYYKKDLDLSFDIKDAYEVDLNNLDFLKSAKAVDTLTKEQVLKIRKDLLFKGKITSDIAVTNHNLGDYFWDLNSTWYDITGGSNYFNDKILERITYTRQKINIKESEFRYRTDSASEEVKLNSLMTEVIYKIISKKMTDEQKIRAIHNWVIDNNEYLTDGELALSNNEPIRSQCRSPYSYFTKPKRRIVCEGYARTFSRFLTLINIPVWYVTGQAANSSGQEGHAWNMVRLGGRELYLDPTWNDPTMGPSMKNYFEGKKMMPHRFTYYLLTWDQIKNTGNTARDFDQSIKKIAAYRQSLGLDYIHVN